MTLAEARQWVAFMRKRGISRIKVDEFEVELGDKPVMRRRPDAEASAKVLRQMSPPESMDDLLFAHETAYLPGAPKV